MKKTQVFILGAGCSYDGDKGYPLAKHFVPALEAYARRLDTEQDCKLIRDDVQITARLLRECQGGSLHANTLDQLVDLILRGQCDHLLANLSKSDVHARRYRAVTGAKIATAALFRDLENMVLPRQVEKYRTFIQRKVFHGSGISDRSRSRLRASTARVLSFNYDRLFELTFRASFMDSELRGFAPYSQEALNSGVDMFGQVCGIAPDRFCFLKMHGSVGMRCGTDFSGQSEILQGLDFMDPAYRKVSDAEFFPSAPQVARLPEPLIAFPYEKDYILQGKDNALAFRSYIETVWAHAKTVLTEASEIWIIGYSFDPTDCGYLIALLKGIGKNCERIVIQNLTAECDRLENLLKMDYGIAMRTEKCPFGF